MSQTELEPFVDAEIAIEGHRSPSDEQRIRSLLSSMGVEDVAQYGGLVVLRYDPLKVTKAQIRDALTAAGFHVAWMTAAPADPVTDALHPQRASRNG
jgi:hypothetical protein